MKISSFKSQKKARKQAGVRKKKCKAREKDKRILRLRQTGLVFARLFALASVMQSQVGMFRLICLDIIRVCVYICVFI